MEKIMASTIIGAVGIGGMSWCYGIYQHFSWWNHTGRGWNPLSGILKYTLPYAGQGLLAGAILGAMLGLVFAAVCLLDGKRRA